MIKWHALAFQPPLYVTPCRARQQNKNRQIPRQPARRFDEHVGTLDELGLEALAPAYAVLLEGADAKRPIGNPEAAPHLVTFV